MHNRAKPWVGIQELESRTLLSGSGFHGGLGGFSAIFSNPTIQADIAKLKWLEGTWKGMDGDKPFFERYRFEGDSKMIVEGSEAISMNVSSVTRRSWRSFSTIAASARNPL
jgi:hypothetical protein